MTNWGANETCFLTFFVLPLSVSFCQNTTFESLDLTVLLSLSSKEFISLSLLMLGNSKFSGYGASSLVFFFWSLMILILFVEAGVSLRGEIGSISKFYNFRSFCELYFGVKNFLTSDWDSNFIWEVCRTNFCVFCSGFCSPKSFYEEKDILSF